MKLDILDRLEREAKQPAGVAPVMRHVGQRNPDPLKRIAQMSAPADANGCVLWLGSVPGSGYPTMMIKGRTWVVSRFLLGLTDPSQVACHRCDTPRCVNIAHLFAGSRRDNARDMSAKGRAASSRKTHCPSGHPYDAANTYWGRLKNGTMARHCRACRREHGRKSDAKRRGGARRVA